MNNFHFGDKVRVREGKNKGQEGSVEIVREDEALVKFFGPPFTTRYYLNQLEFLEERNNMIKNVVIDGVEYAPKQEYSEAKDIGKSRVGSVVQLKESYPWLGLTLGTAGVITKVSEDGIEVVFIRSFSYQGKRGKMLCFSWENLEVVLDLVQIYA